MTHGGRRAGAGRPKTAGPFPCPKCGTPWLRSGCKTCPSRECRARLAEKARQGKYRRKYGITVDDYERMLHAQRGVCDICQRPPRSIRLAVDHDHKTGKIRGLLCGSCNRRAGWCEDFALVEKTLTYLRRHRPMAPRLTSTIRKGVIA